MAIPDYQTIMLPLLKLLGDRQEHSLRDSIESLARDFGLTEEERNELLPSGRKPIFDNRVGWAKTYLKKAGLVETTRRGYFQIKERGLKILQDNPPVINDKFLEQFTEFLDFHARKAKDGRRDKDEPLEKQTPRELIEDGYQRIRQNLAQELLSQVKKISPKYFEKLVVELLVNMGYGGSLKDAEEAIGKSGDEGIDGIIKEDRLGLDIIYIQAKRWDGAVSRDEIHKFVGALEGKRAKKGIFITTSRFSTTATEYVKQINAKVVLIDGENLAQHMIDFNVGVSRESFYEIKKIDTDYFEDG